MKTCPKCGYARTSEDSDKPDDQCPKCGVYYAKAVKAIEALEKLKAKKTAKEAKKPKPTKPPEQSRRAVLSAIKTTDMTTTSNKHDLTSISLKRKIFSISLTGMLIIGTTIAINKSFSPPSLSNKDAKNPAIKNSIEAIRNDYPVVQAAKMNIAEQYAYEGVFPKSNTEAHLPSPEKFRGMTLLSLKISEGGRINLEFDALSGHDGGLIQIIPDSSLIESIGLQWRCMTSDYPDIDKIIKDCKYIEKN